MSGRLLALDPGGTTGWSLWEYDSITPLRPIEHGQIVGGVEGFIEWWKDSGIEYEFDEVVSESYRLDGRTPKPDVTPLRIEGALAVLWPEVVYQPNTYKAIVTDERIKALGLWWPGQQHARDSLRHAWARMKHLKHMPTLLAGGWGPKRKPVA